MIARFKHTLHVCLKAHYWVAYVAMFGGAIGIAISSLNWQPHVTAAFLAGYFELFGSIAFAMGLAHVFTVDYDEGAKEVLLTYPTPRLVIACERLLAGWTLSGVPLLLLAGVMYWFIGTKLDAGGVEQLQMGGILTGSAASWLFLSGITLLAASMAENWLAGVLVGGLYWIVELISDGQFTGNLFLFARTFPSATILPDVNQWLLFAIGAATCTVSVLLFGRNRTRW